MTQVKVGEYVFEMTVRDRATGEVLEVTPEAAFKTLYDAFARPYLNRSDNDGSDRSTG